MSKKLIVSICCITFNQEKYIRDAFESFLMQKTDFPFEIIVHDDASTDSTASIIREYKKKYPGLFVTILQRENQYSQGIKPWFAYVFPKARGKYIALCDGDDYWTDPHKLQKQVDYLEENPEFSIATHEVEVLHQGVKEVYPFQTIWNKNEFTFEDELDHHFAHTSSYLFKREYIHLIPQCIKECISGDIPLLLFILTKGKAWYLHKNMGVYRRNQVGITHDPVRKKNQIRGYYEMWKCIQKFTPDELQKKMKLKLAGYERAFAKKQAKKLHPNFIKYLWLSLIHDFSWYSKKLYLKKF